MKISKLIGLIFVRPVEMACSLPKVIARGMAGRKRRIALNELEAERLDRIRHPSKYVGK
jgi:hypothetical protein